MASDKKRVYINFVTPAGVAIFPRVNKPDTKFKAEGVYSTRMAFKPEAIEDFIAKYTETLDEFEVTTRAALTEVAEGKDKKKAKAAKDNLVSLSRNEIGKPEVGDDGEETGRIVINFKLNASYTNEKGETKTFQPKLFDSKGNKTTVDVWGGSVLKIAGTVNPYYSAKDNEIGVSFRLSGVKIIKLVTKGGQTADSMGLGGEEEGGWEDEGGGDFDSTPAQDVPANAKPAKGADF